MRQGGGQRAGGAGPGTMRIVDGAELPSNSRFGEIMFWEVDLEFKQNWLANGLCTQDES